MKNRVLTLFVTVVFIFVTCFAIVINALASEKIFEEALNAYTSAPYDINHPDR